MYLFRNGTRQRGGASCSSTLIPPLTTRSTGTYHGYGSWSRYRFYRGFGDPSMPTPRTGLRRPARAPSRLFCDHYLVTLVRLSQPTVWVQVRVLVAVIFFARRYLGFSTFPRVATRRPAPLVGRAICCCLERHAFAPASSRRQFGHGRRFDVGHRCDLLSVKPRGCAISGRCMRGRGGGGGRAQGVGLVLFGADT